MRPNDMDADTKELLDEIQRESDMRFAYIAGVGKGLELAQPDTEMSKQTFHDEVRRGFWDYLESGYRD